MRPGALALLALLCAVSAQALPLPANYQVTGGSVLIDIGAGIGGTLTNAKAYGSGTSSGADNTDPAYIKVPGTAKNIAVTIVATGGATAHNLDWTISKKLFASDAGLVGFWLLLPDASKVNACTLMLTPDNFANYFQVNMTGFMAKRDGWNFVAAHRDDFSVGGGTPTWGSTMTRARLQCEVQAGQTATYYVGEFYAGFYARPQVVFRADDNFGTLCTTLKTIMDAAGWKATMFIQGQRINASQYCTDTQLRALKAAGWELYNHTRSHGDLSAMSADEITAEIAGGEADLAAIGLEPTGPKHFAYPFGNFSETVKGILRARGYLSATAVGGNSFTPYMAAKGYEADEFQVEATELNSSVSTGQAIAELQQAMKYGGILVYLVHHLDPASAGPSSYLAADFQTVVNAVKAAERAGQVDVVMYGQMLAGLRGRRVAN